MATSPLFGWQEPDDTSLVKDGAAAIRTLGNAIDTSMGDLLGGTTGQVLAKASNTNMDFTWVAQDDSNAIQNAIVDAKGDLIAASANDTPSRLAVGNNGETLVADSSTSTGLRYTAGIPIPNPVLNSAMQIWQRGTSFAIPSGANTYTADRWACFRGATGVTVSRQNVSDTTNLPFIQYVARVQRDSGNTSTVVPYLAQNFETVNAIPYAGKTVTVSFYARRGANYSSANNYLSLQVLTGTGTDQSWLSYTGLSFVLNQNDIVLTTTIQRFSYTFTIGATATEFAPIFSYTPVGTAGANDWFEVTGVQFDVGSVALPFRTNGGTIQGETSACQRYYYRTNPQASGRYGAGQCTATTNATVFVSYPVTMRTNPTALEQSGTAGDYRVQDSTGNGVTCSAVPTHAIATTAGAQLNFTVASGITAGNATIAFNTGTAGFLGWSAEL